MRKTVAVPEPGQRWALDDAERRHAEAPDSFFVPPPERRTGLRVGDVVKLLFVLEDPAAGGVDQVERMWVEIDTARGGHYQGVLLNRPVTNHALSPGCRVEFAPEHVAAIAVDSASLGYDPDRLIAVSRLVLEAGSRPGAMYWELAGDARDSGWQAFAGDETDDYLAEVTNCRMVDLGWFAERHPEIEPALRDPRAGWWSWDHEASEYVHQPE